MLVGKYREPALHGTQVLNISSRNGENPDAAKTGTAEDLGCDRILVEGLAPVFRGVEAARAPTDLALPLWPAISRAAVCHPQPRMPMDVALPRARH